MPWRRAARKVETPATAKAPTPQPAASHMTASARSGAPSRPITGAASTLPAAASTRNTIHASPRPATLDPDLREAENRDRDRVGEASSHQTEDGPAHETKPER